MTVTHHCAMGGETADDMIELITMYRSSAVTTVTTAAGVQTGNRCLLFPTATDAAKAIAPAYATPGSTGNSGRIHIISGWFRFVGSPSAEIGLISNATQGGTRYFRWDTSGHLVFYGTGSTPIFTTVGAISSSARTHIGIMIDFLTPGNGTGSIGISMINVWVNGVLDQSMLVSGITALPTNLQDTCFGEWLAAATNRGSDFYADDLCWSTTTSRLEAAHLVAANIMKVSGGATLPATADGSNVAWTASGAVSDFQCVDEFPNDADTTHLFSTANSQKETMHYTASNPMASTDAAHAFVNGMVFKLGGAGKATLFKHLIRDDSGNELAVGNNTPTTSYSGDRVVFDTPPAGGSWAYTDGDLNGSSQSKMQFGVQEAASGTAGNHVSLLTGEWLYSSANLGFGRAMGQG